MRWVLSGVQSGRYLAPSSRALSRSSERKGFWKPLSTTTTPLRIFPISCGPARGPLCSVPSRRGFPGTAPCAGAGTEAVAGVETGAGTAEAKEQVQLALLGLNPSPFLPQIQSPSPQCAPAPSALHPYNVGTEAPVGTRNPICSHLGLLRAGGEGWADGLLGAFLSS